MQPKPNVALAAVLLSTLSIPIGTVPPEHAGTGAGMFNTVRLAIETVAIAVALAIVLTRTLLRKPYLRRKSRSRHECSTEVEHPAPTQAESGRHVLRYSLGLMPWTRLKAALKPKASA